MCAAGQLEEAARSHAQIQKLLGEYQRLDYEDVVAGMPCKFRCLADTVSGRLHLPPCCWVRVRSQAWVSVFLFVPKGGSGPELQHTWSMADNEVPAGFK